MSCSRAINWKLRNTPGVYSLVGGQGNPRVFPILGPQAEKGYPRVVYQCESDAEEMTSDGPAGMSVQKVKVYAVGLTYSEQTALSAAVRSALNGQSGTWDTIPVQGVFFEDVSENEQQGDAGEDSVLYVAELEFTVCYEPS